MDPHTGTLMFAVVALLIGVVVFGGTMLAYFLDKHRPDSTARAREHRSRDREEARAGSTRG